MRSLSAPFDRVPSNATGPDSEHNLEIWQTAIGLVKQVYSVSARWPTAEVYGITAQTRRAAISVPVNIAEGIGRGAVREAARYAQIARGSLYGLDTLLELAAPVGVCQPASIAALRESVTDLARRISAFIRYQRKADSRERG